MKKFNRFSRFDINSINFLINYNWSTTTENNQRYLVNSGTLSANALLESGQGKYFNGVDQLLSNFTIPPTATNMYYFKDGVFVSTTSLIDFSQIVPVGIYKDVYYFSRALDASELDLLNNQPEQFFNSTPNGCLLKMPMNDKDDFVREYIANTDYVIQNFLTTTNTNAQNLPYGLQDAKLITDSLGFISGMSNFFECNGISYADTYFAPTQLNNTSVEIVYNINNLGIEELMGSSGASGFRFRKFTNNTVGLFIGGQSISTSVLSGHTHFLISVSNDVFTFYVDGVSVGVSNVFSITDGTSILLGKDRFSSNQLLEELRLFKIHQKALTQEETIKLYNDAVAKGLLT